MGILPIGFFSPLPLAMMIPFMATQSLAMGEAFGKSFQYGKRKISSMSNEEFNKLTFHDLMVEQTANITAIVPELNKQMAQSKEMQAAIFQEMVNLIPTFFDSLFSALDPKHIENPSLISQASPPPPITEIRYYNDRQGIPEDTPQMEELKRLLEQSLKQAGTKEDLANKLNPPPPPPPTSAQIQASLPASKKVLSASEDSVYIAWIAKLGQLKIQYQTAKRDLDAMLANPVKQSTDLRSRNNYTNYVRSLNIKKNEKSDATRAIRRMSNDYRSPNNHIRENALRLRQAMAAGQWV